MIKIGVFGATGKVGRLLVDEILQNNKCRLSSVFVRNELHYNVPSSTLVTGSMRSLLESSEIIIDFSSSEATGLLLQEASKYPKPLIIGTTGLNEIDMEQIRKISKIVPILYSSNMSMGIAVLNKVVGIISSKLKNFDIEITEVHHRYKRDAPSGTALSLARNVSKERGNSRYIYGREGTSIREKEDISILSLRGGDLAGKHTVGFYGEGEFLEFTHIATSRKTFVKGAIRAALWLYDKDKPSLYSMEDVFEA